MSIYSGDFFEYLREGARSSAKEIVPHICDIIQPESVVDLGCGTATWLSVFQECGVEEIWGIDGDYVEKEKLEIPSVKFHPYDLTKPLNLNKRFDLAVSLEVAEHLPIESADIFVDSLTKLSPVILFSAAIAEQGGVNHINEQWQDYWVRKFENQGYEVIDCIRPNFWNNEKVNYWYAQNTFIFVEQQYLEKNKYQKLRAYQQSRPKKQIRLVHPQKYLEVIANEKKERKAARYYESQYINALQLKNVPLKNVLLNLPNLVLVTIVKKLKNFIKINFNKDTIHFEQKN